MINEDLRVQLVLNQHTFSRVVEGELKSVWLWHQKQRSRSTNSTTNSLASLLGISSWRGQLFSKERSSNESAFKISSRHSHAKWSRFAIWRPKKITCIHGRNLHLSWHACLLYCMLYAVLATRIENNQFVQCCWSTAWGVLFKKKNMSLEIYWFRCIFSFSKHARHSKDY